MVAGGHLGAGTCTGAREPAEDAATRDSDPGLAAIASNKTPSLLPCIPVRKSAVRPWPSGLVPRLSRARKPDQNSSAQCMRSVIRANLLAARASYCADKKGDNGRAITTKYSLPTLQYALLLLLLIIES